MRSNETISTVLVAAKQETETRDPRQWSWVEASVWTEPMLAALGNGVKGGKWYSLIDKVYARPTLAAAWERVKANRGAAGVDGQSIERFEAQAGRYLDELEEALKAGSYQPQPVRRVYIPKGTGRRPLGIPAVKDRIVQTAMKMVLEPIFEWEFTERSYGFRPQRGAKDALREVVTGLQEGYCWVVDADIQGYFDHIPHARLMERLGERVSDGRVLGLVEQYLKQDILEDMKQWTPTSGTPQGAVLSPLLANVYLHPLDEQMAADGYRMIRYADDFVVLCRGQAQAEQALERIRQWTQAQGLTLHPQKTHIGDSRQAGQGFEFLGYRFEAGRWNVRPKSLKAIKEKIRQRTRRTSGVSLKTVIERLNPTLRGWFGYFKHARRRTLCSLDGFIRRRLRAILRKHQRRPGFGRCHADHRRWPNAFFAAQGLFSLEQAHRVACQSRCGNH